MPGEGEEGAVDGPRPVAPVKLPGPGGKSVDLEVLPLRDSDAIDEPAPPPAAEGEKLPQKETPAPEPPTEDGATTEASEPMLRFVSYFRSIAATPGRPEATPNRLWEQTDDPDEPRTLTGDPDGATASLQASQSLPSDEQKDQSILEALRTSFSPPARPQPPAEGPSAPPGN
jgi:hypothetical protein